MSTWNEVAYRYFQAALAAIGGGTASQQVQGAAAQASTTTINPVLVAGRYNATPPTLTDGQLGRLQSDASGNLRVRWVGGNINATDGYSNTLGFVMASNSTNSLLSANANFVFNGTTWDRVKKPNLATRVASSAASGNAAVHKASAGDLVQFWGLCGATAAYLQVYNKATAPTIGTDTPILTYPLIANAAFEQVIPGGGYYFSTGISFAFTTDAAGTTGSAAAAVTSFNMIGS